MYVIYETNTKCILHDIKSGTEQYATEAAAKAARTRTLERMEDPVGFDRDYAIAEYDDYVNNILTPHG